MAMSASSIEDVILTNDRRGMRHLRRFLPVDYCTRAAWALHGACSRVLVVSGFHVNQKCETDGPPGAIALARAIRMLGGQALLVSDGHAARVLADLDDAPLIYLQDFLANTDFAMRALHDGRGVICAPCGESAAASDKLAGRLRAAVEPSAVVAVERCGLSTDGTYRNMLGEDISAVTARLDALFSDTLSIGVGDGGNEIGMGTLAEHCLETDVTRWPCVTRVLFPVISSVSNWGAWGICAGMSIRSGKRLLPTESETMSILKRIVELEGVDGVTRQRHATVDGRSAEESNHVLRQLHALVEAGMPRS